MEDSQKENILCGEESLNEIMKSLRPIKKNIPTKLNIEISREQSDKIISTAAYFICKVCMNHLYQHKEMENQIYELSSISNKLLLSIETAPPIMKLELKKELINLDSLKSVLGEFNDVLRNFKLEDVSTREHIIEERNSLARYLRLILEDRKGQQDSQYNIRHELIKILDECMHHAMKFTSSAMMKIISEIRNERLPEWNSAFWHKIDDENLNILHESVFEMADV